MNPFFRANEGVSRRQRSLRVLCALKRLYTEATEGLRDLCVKAFSAQGTRRRSSCTRLIACAATVIFFSLMMACNSRTSSTSADFFPASNAVQNWVKSNDTRTFEASRLWEYIDGDADKYVQAGVVKTLTSDYRFNGKTDATADVYVMAKADGAKRVYESESTEGSTPFTLGDAGRTAKGTVTFRQGPYFVRLVAYEDSPEIAQALTQLARAISDRLLSAQGR